MLTQVGVEVELRLRVSLHEVVSKQVNTLNEWFSLRESGACLHFIELLEVLERLGVESWVSIAFGSAELVAHLYAQLVGIK